MPRRLSTAPIRHRVNTVSFPNGKNISTLLEFRFSWIFLNLSEGQYLRLVQYMALLSEVRPFIGSSQLIFITCSSLHLSALSKRNTRPERRSHELVPKLGILIYIITYNYATLLLTIEFLHFNTCIMYLAKFFKLVILSF